MLLQRMFVLSFQQSLPSFQSLRGEDTRLWMGHNQEDSIVFYREQYMYIYVYIKNIENTLNANANAKPGRAIRSETCTQMPNKDKPNVRQILMKLTRKKA